MKLENDRVALITGGGGGVGRATAAALLSRGFRVILLGRTPATLERARVALSSARVEILAVDVAARPAVEAAVAEVARRGSRPTLVVNAAGIAASAPLLPPDDDLWARTLATNVSGAWVVSTACLPAMLERGHGSIVNVGSTAALRGYRHVAAYVASKHALLGLTRAMAEDLRAKGIQVNAVCPGFLDTPMTEATIAGICRATGRSAEESRAELAGMNASGRLIEPEEVAAAVVAFVEDPTRTGEALVLE